MKGELFITQPLAVEILNNFESSSVTLEGKKKKEISEAKGIKKDSKDIFFL